MKVAITGSIACGKSTVTSYLTKKNYRILDADKIGHELLENEKVIEKLKEEFSEEILQEGKVDRKKLGSIVFADKEKLKILNSIMHPQIRKEITKQVASNKDKIIFIDMALLFEAKFDDIVDKIIVVHLDTETQLTRLINRNGFSKEEAQLRISSQMSSEEKKKLANYVIDNSGTLEETYKQIDKILERLEGEIDGIKNK